MHTLIWILSYVVLINLLGFIIMGVDKNRARNHDWRIAESTFFIVAVIGGSLGCILGMYAFRHKTRHWYFKFGLPAILIIQLAIIIYARFAPGISITIM
ncbi:MAG: DUF1294 domain-containing protein [Lachnospiraceae bacterium]|nr:DUF1294 domain-containing protein [Lachnospiraceae bacterium]